MSFAENLKTLRIKKQFSQAELAKLVGIAQPMIAQYEKGMKLPTVVVGRDIAKALGTTCEELVDGQMA